MATGKSETHDFDITSEFLKRIKKGRARRNKKCNDQKIKS